MTRDGFALLAMGFTGDLGLSGKPRGLARVATPRRTP